MGGRSATREAAVTVPGEVVGGEGGEIWSDSGPIEGTTGQTCRQIEHGMVEKEKCQECL